MFGIIPQPTSAPFTGEWKASVEIATGEVLAGALPPNARRLVAERVGLHREELAANWTLAQHRQPLDIIDPLP